MAPTLITLNYTMVICEGVFCYEKLLSVVHNYYYTLALLLIHCLRTSICVCKYLYMLSATFHDRGGRVDDPHLSVALNRSTATFCTPEILYIIRKNCYTSQGDPDSSFPLWISNQHLLYRLLQIAAGLGNTAGKVIPF